MSAGPWAVCDRCGFKVRHCELRKEWTNAMVCKSCWDPRPAETRPPRIRPEGLPIRDARPEPEPRFVEPNEITKDDL